jgi:hypothetical protein
MKNSTKFLLLVFFVIVLVYGLRFWADNSPIGSDENPYAAHNPEIALAFDFAFALQMNDPRAYDMITPNLKSRLDTWMTSHKSQECVDGELISSFIWEGTNLGKKITFSCFTDTSSLDFEVDNLVIKDLKVIDWGEVTED